jgi:hypothetical protein
MSQYKISNQYKKNVIETETWTNDEGETITHTTVWRWGEWITNEKPDLSKYDPDKGIDPYDLAEEVELGSMDDGDSDWDFPESWDDEQIETFMQVWDEEWHDAPEQFGFVENDTTYWISGPLEIEEL